MDCTNWSPLLVGVWCGVVWCGVVWCGVVWCGVVWCGVNTPPLLDASPRGAAAARAPRPLRPSPPGPPPLRPAPPPPLCPPPPSTPTPQFNDLMSHSDGTGEGLVAAYFGRIGWPLSVGKGEGHIFASKARAPGRGQGLGKGARAAPPRRCRLARRDAGAPG
jgi:hypothetical protein